MQKSRRKIQKRLTLVSMLMPHLEMKVKMIPEKISTNVQSFDFQLQPFLNYNSNKSLLLCMVTQLVMP